MALAEWGGETDQNVSLSEHEIVFEIKILSESHTAAGSMAGRPLINRAPELRALSVGRSVRAPELALGGCSRWPIRFQKSYPARRHTQNWYV